VNLAVPSIRHGGPARVGDPEPCNLDHAPTGPLPPQCRGRKTGADKACQEVESEAVRHHELVGAPPRTSIGEGRERAALFRAEALRHQIVSLRFIAGAADALPLPNCNQLSRVRDIKQLCRCFDRRVGVRRLDGAKQPGRHVTRQIDVPRHRICGHNTWSLSHAIVAVQLPREGTLRYSGHWPEWLSRRCLNSKAFVLI